MNPLLPPTSGVAFSTATSPKRLQACQHLPSLPVNTPESPAEFKTVRLLPTSRRLSATTASPPTIAPAPASPAMQLKSLPAQATGRALGALPLLHLHPRILSQADLLLNQNTTNVDRYYGSCSGTQTVSQQNSMS